MTAHPYLDAAESLRSNDEQFQAYESTGNCVVLAGPGAGKTKTITVKLAQLLEEEIKRPQQLACITYSNACVGEIRSHLRNLEVGDDDRLHLATVHSFCLTQLVMPYAALAGLNVPDPIVIASPVQSRKLFEKAHQHALHSPAPRWFRIEFDKVRRTLVDRASKEWKNWNGYEPPVIEAYEAFMSKDGLLDFDGIVLTALRLVEENEWVRQCLRAKFPIIVIDEYQDLGLPLHRMVFALMNLAGVRVIAVGDPDQSIYGFTGAQPWLLKSLAESSNVERVRLKLNYRCGDQIIAASQTLLSNPEEVKSHDGRQGTVDFYELGCGPQGQTEYALKTVIPKLLEDTSWAPGDIAILYRSLNEGNAAASAADKLDIPYFRMDNGAPIKRSRLNEWLTICARWCSGGWESGDVSLRDILKDWRALRRSVSGEKETLADRARLVTFLFANRDGTVQLRKWLTGIAEACLTELFAEEKGLGDEAENFDNLRVEASSGGKLADYTVEMFGNQGRSPSLLNLMTLHSSKGLEFKAVIMINLEEGAIPSVYDKTEEAIQEATRLFYVGLTRAISSVHLMYAANESPLVTQVRNALK